jgi:hypothetical protein
MSWWKILTGAAVLLVASTILWMNMCSAELETYPLAVTPNGRILVFAQPAKAGRLTVRDLSTGRTLSVGKEGFYESASVSRDGDYIVASFSEEGKSFSIYKLDINSNAQVRMTEGVADVRPCITRSGDILFWRSTRSAGDFFGGVNFTDFRLMRIKNEAVRTHDSRNFTFRNVGNIIQVGDEHIYSRSGLGLVRISLVDGVVEQVRLPEERFTPFCVGDEPGSMFGSGDKSEPFNYAIFRFVPGGDYTQITGGMGYIENAVYAPMSKELYFISSRSGYEIWRYDIKRSKLEAVSLR